MFVKAIGCMAWVWAVMACGVPPTAFGDESFHSEQPPLQEFTTPGGLTVWLWTHPQPPVRGTNSARFRISGESGGVEGALLEVVPWMPAMGHGAPGELDVREEGGGYYLVTDLNLFMSGLWELRTELRGSVTDAFAPKLQIP